MRRTSERYECSEVEKPPQAILGHLRGSLCYLEGQTPASEAELVGDDSPQPAIERVLQNALQAAMDIAAAVVGLKHLRERGYAVNAFMVLSERGLLEVEFASALTALVPIRDELVYSWKGLDPGELLRHVRQCVPILRRFAALAAE